MGLTMALVAMKTDRLLQAEACTVGPTLESEVFLAFEASSSGWCTQREIEPSFDLLKKLILSLWAEHCKLLFSAPCYY